MTVFCDFLTVTCDPANSFHDSAYDWLSADFPVKFVSDGVSGFSVGDGHVSVVHDKYGKFDKISLSGAALDRLRVLGVFDEVVSVIASVPHRVTRLDAALDVLIDAPVILRALEARYPDDLVKLTRKAMKVVRMYSTRSDGLLSGTWYVGLKSNARVTARVYDKQLESFDKRGHIVPPCTRYELTFGRDHGCTLRDAVMPESIFYEFASPTLLDAPSGVAPWVPHGEGWVAGPVAPRDLTFDVVLQRMEDSPEMAALARLAVMHGQGGIDLLVSVLRRRCLEQLETLGQERGSV